MATDWVTVRHPQRPAATLPDDVLVLTSWVGDDANDDDDPCWRIPMRCSRGPRGWSALGPGLRLAVDEHGLEVQVQGQLLARVASGGQRLVESVLRGVLAWSQQGALVVATSQRDALDSLLQQTRVTRLDVAVDVAVRHRAEEGAVTPADGWLDAAVWGAGAESSATRAADLWSSRARRHEVRDARGAASDDDDEPQGTARVWGTMRRERRPQMPSEDGSLPPPSRPGRTLYVGSRSHSQVCIYEKDLAPRTSASTVLALETLRDACGWDCIARVLRVEHRVTSEWLRDQVLTLRDGVQARAGHLDARTLLALLPQIARELVARHRHTDHTDATVRRRRRRSSPLQLVVERAVEAWSDATGATDLDAVVSRKREAILRRQRRGALLAISRLSGATGASVPRIARDLMLEHARLTGSRAKDLSRDEEALARDLVEANDRAHAMWGGGHAMRDHLARYECSTSRRELERVHSDARVWALAQGDSTLAEAGIDDIASRRSVAGSQQLLDALDDRYRRERERMAA